MANNLLSTSTFKKQTRPQTFNSIRELLDFVLHDTYILDQNSISDSLEQSIINPEYRKALSIDRITKKYTDASGIVENDAVNLRRHYVVDLDIASLFLSILSSTYINGVERLFYLNGSFDEILTEKMNRVYKEIGLDESIATADMYSQVMNPIIYFQKVRDRLFTSVELDYKYFVLEDYYDKKLIDKLVIAHEQSYEHPFVANVDPDLNYANFTFEIWDNDVRIEVNRAGEVVREFSAGFDGEDMGANPYDGEIPGYYLRDTINNQGLHRPVDSGLLDLTTEAMSMIPEILISSLVSAYGQWVTVSNSGKPKISGSLGPFRALHIYNDSETSDIEGKNEKIESNSQDIIRVFDKMISMYSVTKHLDPDIFIMNKSSSQRSGLAVKASQSKLLEQTEARKTLRSEDEKRIFDKLVKIKNTISSNDPIPEGVTLELKFKDSSVFTTDLERINGAVSAFNNSLMDQLTATMEVNGVSRQQAQMIVDKVKDEKKEQMEMFSENETSINKILNSKFGSSQDNDRVTEGADGKIQPPSTNNADSRKP